MSAAELAIEAMAIREFFATVVDATDIGTYAVEYAVNGWEVFPLNGKVPVIPNPHPLGSPERKNCKRECGRDGHGLLDATTDIGKIISWWSGRYRGHNIGVRVPESMLVLDVDGPHRLPHPGKGLQALAQVEDRYGPLPATLTQISGSGGLHLFFRKPPGKLSKAGLPAGLDYKDRGGQVVGAPSIHPDSGERYVWCDYPVADPPRWLIDMIVEKPPHPATPPRRRSSPYGHLRGVFSGSIADQFSSTATWAKILMPHGWALRSGDGEADGSVWLHPTATSKCSATIRNGCLFAYSSNTPFEVTSSGSPRGYTKFRAYAVLNHDGDMKAAARSLRDQK